MASPEPSAAGLLVIVTSLYKWSSLKNQSQCIWKTSKQAQNFPRKCIYPSSASSPGRVWQWFYTTVPCKVLPVFVELHNSAMNNVTMTNLKWWHLLVLKCYIFLVLLKEWLTLWGCKEICYPDFKVARHLGEVFAGVSSWQLKVIYLMKNEHCQVLPCCDCEGWFSNKLRSRFIWWPAALDQAGRDGHAWYYRDWRRQSFLCSKMHHFRIVWDVLG